MSNWPTYLNMLMLTAMMGAGAGIGWWIHPDPLGVALGVLLGALGYSWLLFG